MKRNSMTIGALLAVFFCLAAVSRPRRKLTTASPSACFLQAHLNLTVPPPGSLGPGR